MNNTKQATKLVAEFFNIKKKHANEHHRWMITEAAKILDDGYHPDLEVTQRSSDFPIYSVGRGDRLNYSGTDADRAVAKVADFLKLPELRAMESHRHLVSAVTGAMANGGDVKITTYDDRLATDKVYVVERIEAA